MTLSALIQSALGMTKDVPEVDVKGIVQDNRQVQAGYIFVARTGERTDGHQFASDAAARGAAAIVGERNLDFLETLPYIRVDNAKLATAKLAATFYGHPSNDMVSLGVTGTDGKTTVSFLLHYLLLAHYKTGLLSTAGFKLGNKEISLEGHFTTPEAPDVQALLARYRDGNCSHVIIESSSHGFAQHRLDEVSYDIGIWTNLSPEHLDFHKTLEHYRASKQELMKRSSISILNRDDPEFESFTAAAHKTISYGTHPESDWRASDIREGNDLRFKLSVKTDKEGLEQILHLPMIGIYNVHNALAALAAAHQVGIELETLSTRLQTFPGVPGRMQIVQREPFNVVVDFAHTPPALEKALGALRPVTKGNLIVVIGAAGERDPNKRAPLGKVAREKADIAIFTEEDSRSENIYAILGEMAKGAIEAGGKATQSYWTIADRQEAIHLAIRMAEQGDTVLLAGKGHERSLEREEETLVWDEVAEAKKALKDRL